MQWCRSLVAPTVVLLATSVLVAQQRDQAAGLERHSWTVNGAERTSLVARPSQPGSNPITVFVFHGHGGNSLNAARTFRIHENWPEALVLYPQGLPTVGQVTDPQGRLPGWQHAPGGEGDRDLKFVDAMLQWAGEQYGVEPSRTFAAGHSNGGSMVYTLWAARADRFAAFAPSSSVFPQDLVSRAKPKPAFIIAGEQDALVPFAAQERSLQSVLRLNRADRAGAPWDGGAVRHASAAAADVIAYIHPGGHPMPGDSGVLITRFLKGVAGTKKDIN
jgi:polyhydroxybutyrate depolymerase